MSALRMIAWGMVGYGKLDPPKKKWMWRQLQIELHVHRMWLHGEPLGDLVVLRRALGNARFRFNRKNKHTGRRSEGLTYGSVRDCCRKALELIEPSNHVTLESNNAPEVRD